MKRSINNTPGNVSKNDLSDENKEQIMSFRGQRNNFDDSDVEISIN